MKAVFLDRDGTVSIGVPTYERVDSMEKAKLLPTTLEALGHLANLDYLVLFITNQAGISEGLITNSEFNQINSKILELAEPSGITVSKTYLCPHAENDNCVCRKPKPKLLLDAAKEYDINLSES